MEKISNKKLNRLIAECVNQTIEEEYMGSGSEKTKNEKAFELCNGLGEVYGRTPVIRLLRSALFIMNEEDFNRFWSTNSLDDYVKGPSEDELYEGLFGGLRDTFGAMKDTFTKGGSYAAHKANRNLQTARQDIANLDQRYGRTNGVGNDAQWKRQMTAGKLDANNAQMQDKINQLEAEKQEAIENVTAEYDEKIAKLTGKYGRKADKINAKADKTIGKYRNQKDALAARRNAAYNDRRRAMNADPYAGFQE